MNDDDEDGYSVEELRVAAAAAAKMIGRSVIGLLGDGQEGAVFGLDDGTVLKVTIEACDAAVCLALSEAPHGTLHPALPIISGVWRIQGASDKGELYAIHRNNLPPPADLKDRISRGFEDVVRDIGLTLVTDYPPALAAAMQAAEAAGFRDVADDLVAVFHALKRDIGITYQDLKAENLGLTLDGVWTVVDFGRCSPPRAALERMLFEEALEMALPELERSQANEPDPG
jgi:hypothetical protein